MRPIVSLFAGIGGLELGLEAAGLGSVVRQVEINKFCRTVLARHWPDADRSVTDVHEIEEAHLPAGTEWILCGGFPCQDVSSAGKRAGLAGKSSGLWYEFARVVRIGRPTGVVVENVRSGAKLWVPVVKSQLEGLGYRVRALGISAADVGAPHRRQRVFIVAVLGDSVLAKRQGSERASEEVHLADAVIGRRGLVGLALQGPRHDEPHGRDRAPLADPGGGVLWLEPGRGGRPDRQGEAWARDDRAPDGDRHGAEPRLGRDADGAACRLDRWPAGRFEPQKTWEPPRVIPAPPPRSTNRRTRVRALGNAVVPQCALIAGLVLASELDS